MAKMFATESAQRVVDRAVQIFGALGVMHGHIAERLYREVRALRIYEGATEIQQLVVARELLGGAANRPLQPGGPDGGAIAAAPPLQPRRHVRAREPAAGRPMAGVALRPVRHCAIRTALQLRGRTAGRQRRARLRRPHGDRHADSAVGRTRSCSPRRTGSRGVLRDDLGLADRQPRADPRLQQRDDRRVLVRRPQGRLHRRVDDAAAAREGADRRRHAGARRRRALRPPARRGAREPRPSVVRCSSDVVYWNDDAPDGLEARARAGRRRSTTSTRRSTTLR